MSDQRPFGTRARLTTDDAAFENITHRYRFMFTSLEERARALDKHLLRIQTELCARLQITELQPVGIPSQEVVWVCGRICCDSTEGKINATSIVLEGSRTESNGRRVKLDVSKLDSFSLFPGQIVLVEGINSSGRTMVATNLIDGIPKPPTKTLPTILLDMHHSTAYQHGQPISVLVASGPFSTAENLLYDPFQDLLVQVLETKPDLLILLGPFVDVSQPLLATGEARLPIIDDDGKETVHESASYETIFRYQIVTYLQSLFSEDPSLPTQIVLVPSLLDGHHECVFPQPPIGDREKIKSEFFEDDLGVLNIPCSTDKDKRVHLLPNPCMFRFNEVLFGMTSNDVLFSLSADETSKNTGNQRLARLAGHILQQQSFSPIFPIPTVYGMQQADLRHSRHWQMGATPDILILPSKLNTMARNVHGTLVLNPGQLTKGINGGTYAELAIHPIKDNNLRQLITDGKEAVPIEHNVFDRTAVNIKRI